MSLASNEALEIFNDLYLDYQNRVVSINNNPVKISAPTTIPLFCNTGLIRDIREMDMGVLNSGNFGNIRRTFKNYIYDHSYVWNYYNKKHPLHKIDKTEFLKEYNKLTEKLNSLGDRFVVCKGYKNTLTKSITYIIIDRLLNDALVLDGLFFVAGNDVRAKYNIWKCPILQAKRIGVNKVTKDDMLIYESNNTECNYLPDFSNLNSIRLSNTQDLDVAFYVMGGGRDVPPTYEDIKTGVFYNYLDNAKTIQIARQDTFPIVCMVFTNIKNLLGDNFPSYNLYSPSTNRYKLMKVEATTDTSFGCFNLLV